MISSYFGRALFANQHYLAPLRWSSGLFTHTQPQSLPISQGDRTPLVSCLSFERAGVGLAESPAAGQLVANTWRLSELDCELAGAVWELEWCGGESRLVSRAEQRLDFQLPFPALRGVVVWGPEPRDWESGLLDSGPSSGRGLGCNGQSRGVGVQTSAF